MNKTKIEIMKYKNDKLSSSLVLLGIFLNVLYFLSLYKNNDGFYLDIKIGLSVLYNLIFMLAAFLCSENLKVYNRKFSIITLIIGLIQIARIFYYPAQAYAAEALPNGKYTYIIVCISLSAACLISASIISYIKSTLLNNYLKEKSTCQQ